MGVKVTGVSAVKSKLNRIAPRTNKEALAEVRKGGEEIAKMAKRMSPVDEGNLEEAIRSEDDQSRDEKNRKVVVVHVDESKSISGRPGKTVGDYATLMHEGVYNLGDKSKEKQSSDSSVMVGRKYLERALVELQDEIVRKVMAAVGNAL